MTTPSGSPIPSPSPRPWVPGASNILPRHLLAGVDLTKSPFAAARGRYRTLYLQGVAGRGKDVLAYNPDYFEGRTDLNGYVYLVKPDTATMFIDLRPNA